MVRLLINAALFAFGLWLVSVAAAIIGWGGVLAGVVLASPLLALALADPVRWGWLVGRPRPPPPPKPVDPAALDGDPVF